MSDWLNDTGHIMQLVAGIIGVVGGGFWIYYSHKHGLWKPCPDCVALREETGDKWAECEDCTLGRR